MREMWFGVLIALGLAAGMPAFAQPAKPAMDAAALLAPTNEDRVLGKPDAPITIVEFASLSCPHCAHFATEVLPKLKQKWIDTGKAKLVFRDFPLDEPALRAEMLTHCVPAERYFPLVETLFETQEKWVLAKDWRAALERTARLAGIGKQQVDQCLANKQLEDRIVQSRLVASTQLGVDATPTFFVNGKKFEGAPTEEAFNQLLSGLAEKS